MTVESDYLQMPTISVSQSSLSVTALVTTSSGWEVEDLGFV